MNKDFSGVTHYTQVDVQPGGINIQHVEHLHQADILEALGIELEVKKKGASRQESDETLLTKLSLCFKDEDTTKRFLASIREMDDTEIVRLAKKYSDSGLCTDASKALWKLLSEADLYKAGYPNWNKQMNQR